MLHEDRYPFLNKGDYPMVVGERRVTSDTLRPTHNPATGEEIGKAYLAGPHEVNLAVAIAQEAFKVWSRLPPARREKLMLRYADLIEEHTDELSFIDTLDNGAPLSGTRAGVTRAVAQLRLLCWLGN